MKLFKVLLCACTLLGLAAARPTDIEDLQGTARESREVRLADSASISEEILKYDSESHSRLETGNPGVAVRGEYRFVDQGKEYKVVYIADHEGYRAQTDEIGIVSDPSPKELTKSSNEVSSSGKAAAPGDQSNFGSKLNNGKIQKLLVVPSEILNYNAETHSRVESGQPGVAVSGEYQFINNDQQYKVTYVADEQGFRAEGDHIPVAAPPVITSSNVQPSHKEFLAPSTTYSQSVVQKTSADSIEILNYDAETHSRLETGQPGAAVSGEYKFINDVKQYKVAYVADEQGFRAQGDHLPVAVPAITASSNTQPFQKASAQPSSTNSQSTVQKTSSNPGEILNYDAETHSRLETGQPGVAVIGEYQFTNDDKQYKVTYVADEQGFRAQGDHLPVAVPAITASSNTQPLQKASAQPSSTYSQSTVQKTTSNPGEILNYDAETHSRLETGQPGVAVSGEYQFTNDDKQYKVTYVADEQGFRAQGDHLPAAEPAVITSSNTQPSQKASAQPSSTYSQSTVQKTSSNPGEILNYDAETHSRLETGQPGVAVSGEYQFTNDDKQYKVTYVADEQGFRAQGDHIPVAVPAAITSSNTQPLQKASAQPSSTYSQLTVQKTFSNPGEILNYDAETHSRLETGQPGVAVSGEFQFTNDDKQYKVTYVADEQGFRAQGDHLPAAAVPAVIPSSSTQPLQKTSVKPSTTFSQPVVQKTSSDSIEILSYDAETHSRLETGQPGVAVSGEYTFINDDKQYKVKYVADEQGFYATGDHIPVAVPAAITSSSVQPIQKASVEPSSTYSQSTFQKTSSSPVEILNYDAKTHTRQESGEPGVAVNGQYTFVNDGKEYKVMYIADEDGFRAEGDHIPALPENFLKSALEKIATSVPSDVPDNQSSQRIVAVPSEILNYDAETHSRQEAGIPGVAVKGGYKYSSEGKEYAVVYIADDQGFRIESEHVAEVSQSSPVQFLKTAALVAQNYDQEGEQTAGTTPPAPPAPLPVEPNVVEELIPPFQPTDNQVPTSDQTITGSKSGNSAAGQVQRNPADCDHQLTKLSAPIAAPAAAYLVPIHFPSVHPFGYYIVQVKDNQ